MKGTEIITKDNVTLAIALIGLCLSVFNVLHDLASNKKSLSITAPYLFCNECNCGYSFLVLEFVNKSNLPITLTRIQSVIDGISFELGRERVRMFEYSHPERRGKVAEDSAVTPISIDPLGYAKILLAISEKPDIQNLCVDLSIGTNRGMIKKKVEIGEKTSDIKEMLKHMD